MQAQDTRSEAAVSRSRFWEPRRVLCCGYALSLEVRAHALRVEGQFLEDRYPQATASVTHRGMLLSSYSFMRAGAWQLQPFSYHHSPKYLEGKSLELRLETEF
jgi:hypothetical protein